MTKTILIVEDKENVRASLASLLETEGYKVVQAANGKEAIKKLDKANPDLCVLDTSMPPGIDGYETCRQIKKVKKSKAKVIIYTATFEKVDPVKGRKAGAADFLVKGRDPEELLKVVRKQLEK